MIVHPNDRLIMLVRFAIGVCWYRKVESHEAPQKQHSKDGGQQFRCDIPGCSYVSMVHSHLTKHKIEHSKDGVRYFPCDVANCSCVGVRAFKYRINFDKHKQTQHSNDSDGHVQRYPCLALGCKHVDDKAFLYRKARNRHMRRQHSEGNLSAFSLMATQPLKYKKIISKPKHAQHSPNGTCFACDILGCSYVDDEMVMNNAMVVNEHKVNQPSEDVSATSTNQDDFENRKNHECTQNSDGTSHNFTHNVPGCSCDADGMTSPRKSPKKSPRKSQPITSTMTQATQTITTTVHPSVIAMKERPWYPPPHVRDPMLILPPPLRYLMFQMREAGLLKNIPRPV
eukprot:gnl/MRDRNA2_/MRDRNA2_32641_c0_seq1.p1 gnl/MRDRNA2_/MRDRNA2_32641_c0~~gnl/MRDRNA2_/MRDRNA2_32641_c0_seq1.p1  ORF type:complete len:340 (-),score=36.51 gnl/MRDRNA2_/MRDRNA2_32641_c0_seq1:28-1047(-)